VLLEQWVVALAAELGLAFAVFQSLGIRRIREKEHSA